MELVVDAVSLTHALLMSDKADTHQCVTHSAHMIEIPSLFPHAVIQINEEFGDFVCCWFLLKGGGVFASLQKY